MKTIFALALSTILFACNSNQKDHKINQPKKETPTEKVADKKSKKDTVYELISAYDNPKMANQIIDNKKTLKELSDKQVFLDIQTKLLPKLPSEQQTFFQENPDYELISLAKGSLFEKNSNDFAFIVYDKKKNKISILFYNGVTDKYVKLHEDIKVIDGFRTEVSDDYPSGSPEYQFANDFLIYDQSQLEKSTNTYLEYPQIKITDISKDEDFVLKHGSFAKKASKTNLAHTFCIATSNVYSNWDCLQYNKTNNTFLYFYTQAFAD